MRYLQFVALGASALLATSAAAQISTSGNYPGPGNSVLTGTLVQGGTTKSGALAVSGNTGHQSPVPIKGGVIAGSNSVTASQPPVHAALYGYSGSAAAVNTYGKADAGNTEAYRSVTVAKPQ